MSINCIALGKRICFYRLKFNITQEKLAALTNCSREYIAYLESGTKTPSLPTLIDLANVLHISVDDLLVDSLDYSFSTSGSDLHRLLLDCNQTEQEIIIRIVVRCFEHFLHKLRDVLRLHPVRTQPYFNF